eukprot:2178029-Prymnesium_polylepis.2
MSTVAHLRTRERRRLAVGRESTTTSSRGPFCAPVGPIVVGVDVELVHHALGARCRAGFFRPTYAERVLVGVLRHAGREAAPLLQGADNGCVRREWHRQCVAVWQQLWLALRVALRVALLVALRVALCLALHVALRLALRVALLHASFELGSRRFISCTAFFSLASPHELKHER